MYCKCNKIDEKYIKSHFPDNGHWFSCWRVYCLRLLPQLRYERQMQFHGENTVPTFLILPTVELALLTTGIVFMAWLPSTRMQRLIIKTDFLPSKRAVYVTSTPENNMWPLSLWGDKFSINLTQGTKAKFD